MWKKGGIMATILKEEKRRMRITISLAREIIQRIDNERGDIARSRFVERLIRRGFNYS